MVVRQVKRTKTETGRANASPAKVGVRSVTSNARAVAAASRRADAGERNCSVARTLDTVSDAWAFLVIREAFFETRTFESFRVALGIPRATLTDRLRKLTRLG